MMLNHDYDHEWPSWQEAVEEKPHQEPPQSWNHFIYLPHIPSYTMTPLVKKSTFFVCFLALDKRGGLTVENWHWKTLMLNIGFGKLVTWVTGLKSKFANIIFDIEFCLFYQFFSFLLNWRKKTWWGRRLRQSLPITWFPSRFQWKASYKIYYVKYRFYIGRIFINYKHYWERQHLS